VSERTAAAVVVALRLEALAVRRHVGGVAVLRTGMGPRRVAGCAPLIADRPGWVSAGFCGGLAPFVRPGDLVVAHEVVVAATRYAVPAGRDLARRLRGHGLRVHLGSVAATAAVVHGTAREKLAAAGHLAVDMESGALAELAAGRPFAVVRAVVDTAAAPLVSPGTPFGVLRALRSLRIAAPEIGAWARAVGTVEAAPAVPIVTESERR
jgi:4-hydroxy-3-methylbut-2-enyl diphosphate reductase